VYGKTNPPISVCVDDSGMPYGIYSHGVTDVTQDEYLFNLVSSVKTNVNKTSGRSIAEKPGFHKYFIDREGMLRAQPMTDMSCDYDYIAKKEKVFMLPVYTTTSVLTNNNDGMIYAKDVNVNIKYLSISAVPYFNWIKWHDQYYTKYYNRSPLTIWYNKPLELTGIYGLASRKAFCLLQGRWPAAQLFTLCLDDCRFLVI
jgi:hypothetical protein